MVVGTRNTFDFSCWNYYIIMIDFCTISNENSAILTHILNNEVNNFKVNTWKNWFFNTHFNCSLILYKCSQVITFLSCNQLTPFLSIPVVRICSTVCLYKLGGGINWLESGLLKKWTELYLISFKNLWTESHRNNLVRFQSLVRFSLYIIWFKKFNIFSFRLFT